MSVTTPHGTTASQDKQSLAPACQQGGRARGVYAPNVWEGSPDAAHGSVGINSLLAFGATPDAATTEALDE